MLGIVNRTKRLVTVVSLALATAGVPGYSVAQPEKTKVTLAYASMSGAFAAFWVAQENGYFKQEGLQVELLSTRTTVGLMALNSGQIDAIGTGCAEFFEANKQGFSNKVVASLLENNIYLLASAKNITDAKMLAGKTVAVNQIGDTGHLSVRAALRKLGLNPETVTYVQVGSTPERFSAIANGAVAAAIQSSSLKPLVLSGGMNVIFDLQQEKAPSCLAGIGVSEAFLQKNPMTVEALLRAIVRGNAFMGVRPDDQLKAIFSKYMRLPVNDQQLLLAWRYFTKDAHYRKPKITREGAQAVLDMMSEGNSKWRGENPMNYIDTKPMEKLEQSGYLDSVYVDLK